MQQYRVYRASKNGGAASYFDLRVTTARGRSNCVFWQMAQQNGSDENDNAKFFWDEQNRSITTKLNANDIGAILSVLRGKTVAIGNDKNGLYHANSRGNTVLRFQFIEKDGRAYYGLGLSSQRDGERTEIKHTMSLEEGEVLETLLSGALVAMFGWTYDQALKQPKPAPQREESETLESVNF